MTNTPIDIVSYQPEYASYFNLFNRDWLEEYFKVEPIDDYVLTHPEEAIINQGGYILFAVMNNQVIGTVALKPVSENVYELTKMAVDRRKRGLGAGQLLCKRVVGLARALGAKKVILYSQKQLKPALGIYLKNGFVDRPVVHGVYARADVMMELNMGTDLPEKWFDRSFPSELGPETFKPLLNRLKLTSSKLTTWTIHADEKALSIQPNNQWSVKENIGHLSILEPLWLKRFAEIKAGLTEMSQADLSNAATGQAHFNDRDIVDLIREFEELRRQSIHFLESLSEQDLYKSSVHPRLKQAMRMTDFMNFVADHDDHHLQTIQNLDLGYRG